MAGERHGSGMGTACYVWIGTLLPGKEFATAVTYNNRQLHFFQSAVTGVYITSPNTWYSILTSILTHNLVMNLICKLRSHNSQEAMCTVSKCFYMYLAWRWPMWAETCCCNKHQSLVVLIVQINPYPTAFPYGNGKVLHFYQQQESSTTKTVHKVINRGLKAYV